MVFESAGDLQAVDINTNKALWTINDFWMDIDSEILFAGGFTVVMSYEEILLVDSRGQKTFVNLNDNRQDNIDLVAVSKNYIYVISSGWVLEAYDILANKMIWETPTDRGGTQVFYDSPKDIAYVINVSSIRAFKNSTGELLWQYDMQIDQSAYDNGVLYTCFTPFKGETYKINAFSVEMQRVLWEYEAVAPLGLYIYGCNVYENALIANTSTGLFAFGKEQGNYLWQVLANDTFYVPPVLFRSTLYSKGSSKRVYAISFASGNVEGYIRLETPPFFAEPSYETSSKIYLLQDGIAVKTKNSIFYYRTTN